MSVKKKKKKMKIKMRTFYEIIILNIITNAVINYTIKITGFKHKK
jgi:hypothetical protein